jgi:lysozyme family protein
LLDGAINSGPAQSIKWVQRALGITADGVLGTVTIQRIMDHPDHDLLIAAILDRRMAFLRSLKTFYHFGHGWSARVEQLRKTGQAWATGANETPHFFVGNMNKKARIIDAEPLLSTAPADATAAGGTVAAALTGIQTVLQPLQGHSPVVDQVLLALVVLGGGATAFGMAYSWWVRRRNATLTDSLDLAPVKPPNDNLFVPQSVLSQYVDPNATGSSTGNIAPGVVTASGRQSGDTETRVNEPAPIPASKVSVDSAA